MEGVRESGQPVGNDAAEHIKRRRRIMFRRAQLVVAALVILVALAMWLTCDSRRQMNGIAAFLPVAWLLVTMFAKPLHGSLADVVVGWCGAAALDMAALAYLPGSMPRLGTGARDLSSLRTQARHLFHACSQWAVVLLVVFVLFVAAGFLIQMLRRERTDLVVSLSQNVFVNAALASSVGWMFFPVVLWYLRSVLQLGHAGGSSVWFAIGATVVALLLVIAVVMVSGKWVGFVGASQVDEIGMHSAQDASTQGAIDGADKPDAERGSVAGEVLSAALLPFVLSGLVVFVLAVVLLLLVV